MKKGKVHHYIIAVILVTVACQSVWHLATKAPLSWLAITLSALTLWSLKSAIFVGELDNIEINNDGTRSDFEWIDNIEHIERDSTTVKTGAHSELPCKNCAVIVTGKNSAPKSYLIPNVVEPSSKEALRRPNMIDTEYEKTMAFMSEKGYDINVLKLEKPTNSPYFKPVFKISEASKFNKPLQFPENIFNLN